MFLGEPWFPRHNIVRIWLPRRLGCRQVVGVPTVVRENLRTVHHRSLGEGTRLVVAPRFRRRSHGPADGWSKRIHGNAPLAPIPEHKLSGNCRHTESIWVSSGVPILDISTTRDKETRAKCHMRAQTAAGPDVKNSRSQFIKKVRLSLAVFATLVDTQTDCVFR